MARNYYQILEADEYASQEALLTSFQKISERLNVELDNGSPTAKEELWTLRQVYETLSSPGKRAAYDDGLKGKKILSNNSIVVSAEKEGLSWKTNILLIALLASGLIGFGLHLGRSDKKDEHTAKVLQTNRNADNDATRASSERILVEGVVNNDSKIIDRSAELGNRSLNIQQDAENRKRQELEYRANAGSQILEMQRERMEREFAMQKEYREDDRRQAEERRVANERQYWACMNAALDRMTSAAASANCGRYR